MRAVQTIDRNQLSVSARDYAKVAVGKVIMIDVIDHFKSERRREQVKVVNKKTLWVGGSTLIIRRV